MGPDLGLWCLGFRESLNTPNQKQVHNPVHYFSGHYQQHGVNVQAICDANLQFIYFGVVGPGRSNNTRAFNGCIELRKWMATLPDGYFLVGDNAYSLNQRMLIPFSGAQKHHKRNWSSNFHLLQLRIQIKMAFGRLNTKWQIFHQNLDCKLTKVS